MGTPAHHLVAIGERQLVRGYALAGATVMAAEGTAAVRQAWDSLDPGVTLVILTAAAARHLDPPDPASSRLVAVLPESVAVPQEAVGVLPESVAVLPERKVRS